MLESYLSAYNQVLIKPQFSHLQNGVRIVPHPLGLLSGDGALHGV